MTFGHYLRRVREQRGMSQQDTAALAGISPQYYNDIERNRRAAPSDEILPRLASVLDAPLDILYYYAGRFPPDLMGCASEDQVGEIMAFLREELQG